MGYSLVLKDVKHIPNLCLNLISASKLDDAGYNVNLSDQWLKSIRDSLIMARGSKCYSLYKLQALIAKHEIYMVDHD